MCISCNRLSVDLKVFDFKEHLVLNMLSKQKWTERLWFDSNKIKKKYLSLVPTMYGKDNTNRNMKINLLILTLLSIFSLIEMCSSTDFRKKFLLIFCDCHICFTLIFHKSKRNWIQKHADESVPMTIELEFQ